MPRAGARLFVFGCAVVFMFASGCSKSVPAPRHAVDWLAGRVQPAFDPDGPPDALRWALERQLSLGLTERDSSGVARLALADSVMVSADSLTWTFRLRAGTRFTDGSPLTSAHVRDALTAGLARTDHSTRAWLLAAVAGVAQVRAGKPLPLLGIAVPNERTLVLRLSRPDRRLLDQLSVPGVSTPWKSRTGNWADAIGVGPWRVASADRQRALTLVAAAPVAGVAARAETLRVRFTTGAARVRATLRNRRVDVVWPLPPEMLTQPLPANWSVVQHRSLPERKLLLVLRADVPPTTKPEVRQSLAHALNREELLIALGGRGASLRRWLPGARDEYPWARLETRADQTSRHTARDQRTRGGGDGRPESYHFVLAYDADLAGAEIARSLQGQWASKGHYAELRPLRGADAVHEALSAGTAQAQLVESQALLTGAEAELALLVAPLRGPAVGGFRTGWRTREFDRWLALPDALPGVDPDAVQRVLAAEQVVLPLAGLPWQLAIRTGGPPPAVHPAFGPGWTGQAPLRGTVRNR